MFSLLPLVRLFQNHVDKSSKEIKRFYQIELKKIRCHISSLKNEINRVNFNCHTSTYAHGLIPTSQRYTSNCTISLVPTSTLVLSLSSLLINQGCRAIEVRLSEVFEGRRFGHSFSFIVGSLAFNGQFSFHSQIE